MLSDSNTQDSPQTSQAVSEDDPGADGGNWKIGRPWEADGNALYARLDRGRVMIGLTKNPVIAAHIVGAHNAAMESAAPVPVTWTSGDGETYQANLPPAMLSLLQAFTPSPPSPGAVNGTASPQPQEPPLAATEPPAAIVSPSESPARLHGKNCWCATCRPLREQDAAPGRSESSPASKPKASKRKPRTKVQTEARKAELEPLKAWARERGYDVPEYGRIKHEIFKHYNSTHPGAEVSFA